MLPNNSNRSDSIKGYRGPDRVFDGKHYSRTRLSDNNEVGADESLLRITNGVAIKGDRRILIKPIIKTTVQKLDLECVRPQRAGIIIYTVKDGVVYLGWGLDSRSHDLTDFGGRVEYETDLNAVQGALREFNEETLQIFNLITIKDIERCPVIYDNNNMIIFIHMMIDPDEVDMSFSRKYTEIVTENQKIRSEMKNNGTSNRDIRRVLDPEVCGTTWLTWEEFQSSILEKGVIFSRVQRFLNRAGDFSYLL